MTGLLLGPVKPLIEMDIATLGRGLPSLQVALQGLFTIE